MTKFLAGAFGAGCFLFVGFIPCPSFAQEEISLESYLETDEPPQKNLASSQEEKKQDVVVPAPVPAPAAQAIPSQQNENDALPAVKTRLRIETDGFDYTASKNIVTELGDPNDPSYKSQAEKAEEIRQEAFDAAITGMFPLQPDHIRALLEHYDKTKRAAETPVHSSPRPEISVKTLSLDPGVAPLALKTATGHITTLNILDVTGAPWPVQDVSWAGDFEVIEPEEGGHVIRITPMAVTAYGNMSIRLLTLKTPITISLRTETDVVQYRVDARIPEFGPFAQTPLIDGGSERVAGNALITSILDGTPPSSAVKLDVGGVDGRTSAYKIQGMTYVRTPLTLLSPGWEQSVSSADGMHVYALDDTPVLLLSDRGRFMRASLKVGKDLFDE